MTIVIKDPGLGEKAGSGFGEALRALAENRLGRMQQLENIALQQAQQQQQYRQQASGLQQLLGLSPEQSLQAAYAPKEVLGQYAKQKFAEPGNAAYLSALQQALGSPQSQQPSGLQQTLGMSPEQVQSNPNPTQSPFEISPGLNAKQATDLAKLKLKSNEAERKAVNQQEQLGLKKSANERAENKEVREYSKPFIEKANKSKANIRDYTDLIKTVDRGNVRSGPSQQILDTLGLGGFFKNFDTQKADKIVARLAQNIGGAFGSGARITNYLEQTFQRSLPSLWNTNEGIIGISLMNLAVDKANIVKDNIRKELIEKNNGKLPGNIDDKIEELAAPQIRKIEDEAIRSVDAVTSGKTVNSIEDAKKRGIKRIRDLQTGEIIEL